MTLSNPKKSVNRESHYARSVRGADHPIIDLNNPVLVVSHNETFGKMWRNINMLMGAERVDRIAFLNTKINH